MIQQRFFFSHLRRGIRTALTSGPTATFDLILDADGAERVVAIRDLPVAGPEHARGIVPTAVRKQYPPDGSADLRAGELPYVEWKDPALPWALTPRAPVDGRLSPFIALICIPAPTGGQEWLLRGTLPLPRAIIQVPQGLPDPASFELMAHVEDPESLPVGATSLRAFSRLLCPQRLSPRTQYVALVVPLFEAGRLAGLGDKLPESGASGFAWTAGATAATLPVYLSWTFTTGLGRGAEDMLRSLFAVPPKGDLPKVPVDPDAALEFPSSEVGRVIEKRAVFAVQKLPKLEIDTELAKALDVSTARLQGHLSMPAYGRGFAGDTKLSDVPPQGWYFDVNLDLSLRVMAGYGAAIVRRRQDEIVAFVLDSAGQIEEANAVLTRAHTAMALTRPLYDRLSALEMNTSALDRLIGPAAARSRRNIGSIDNGSIDNGSIDNGSIGSHVDGTVDGILQDPTLHRAMAAGGSLDRSREPRVDPAKAIHTKATDAAKAPTVPGATPIGNAMIAIDSHSASETGVIDGSIKDLLDLINREFDLVLGFPPRHEEHGLGEAHDRRRDRQDEDRRRPDRRSVADVVRDRVDLRSSILAALHPGAAVPPRIADRIDGLPTDSLPRRLLAEPVWPYPIVSELFALDPATLSPGLTNLPADGVMGLSFDAAAIDAVVLGANTEVLRELRWRGVPHDPLTSPVLRVFPAPSREGRLPPDTVPLRSWQPHRPLGGGRVGEIKFVVLIRSQLFRKYPETVISLVEAAWDPDEDRRELNPNLTHLPRIMGQLGDEITYVGFSQDRGDMVGDPDPAVNQPGGFLVFEQPDGGLTFGLNDDVDDEGTPRTLATWNELAWSDLAAPEISAGVLAAQVDGPLVWGRNSATMAAILVERRVTVALHVSDIAGEALP